MKNEAPSKIANTVRFPVYEFMILFLPVAVIALVVGASFSSMRTDAEIQSVLDDDNTRLQFIGGFIGAQVSGSLSHLLSISEEAVVKRSVSSPDRNALRALQSHFLTFARRNPYYEQIRWIDASGRERVRITRTPEGPVVEPADHLQNKADRYYFQVATKLLPGEIYLSPVDFNVEHNKIETPLNPVLRIAKPLVDEQRRSRGILIFNIAMRPVFDAVEGLGKGGTAVEYHLVNRKGELLHKPISAKMEVGDAIENFAALHADLWKRLSGKQTGSVEAEDGLWTWTRLKPPDVFSRMRDMFPEQVSGIDQLVSDEFELTLVANRPVSFLLDTRSESRMLVSLTTIVGLAVYGLSMYLYLSGHVREQRAQLHAGYAVARAENLEKMKKLEERFHRLFEASSIGQLVVGGDGRIEIVNVAAETLLGYEPDELKGLPVETLLPKSSRKQHEHYRDEYLQSPEPRKMGGGRQLDAVTKSGEHISVEVGLNPYMDDGKQLVLVSIIDHSKHGTLPQAAAPASAAS